MELFKLDIPGCELNIQLILFIFHTFLPFIIGLNQCFSIRGTVRTCADEKNCSADDKRSADKCG